MIIPTLESFKISSNLSSISAMDNLDSRVRSNYICLLDAGEKERLMFLLNTKLIECGWREKLNRQILEVLREVGPENIRVEELIARITPKARELIPAEIKLEMIQLIQHRIAEKFREKVVIIDDVDDNELWQIL